MTHEYKFCQALHFADKRSGNGIEFELYCKKGNTELALLQPPLLFIQSLLTDQDARAKAFCNHIRQYNSVLAFTSVSFTKDLRLNLYSNVRYFQIYRELFYWQGPLQPGSQELPRFVQLFFYNPDYATNACIQQFGNSQGLLDREILLELYYILDSINHFVCLYKTAKEQMETAPQDKSLQILLSLQMRLVIETGADRRRENLPTANNLAAIIPDEYGQGSFRDIVLEIRNPICNSPKLSCIFSTSTKINTKTRPRAASAILVFCIPSSSSNHCKTSLSHATYKLLYSLMGDRFPGFLYSFPEPFIRAMDVRVMSLNIVFHIIPKGLNWVEIRTICRPCYYFDSYSFKDRFSKRRRIPFCVILLELKLWILLKNFIHQ
jgi:hypothetical protein